VMGADGAGQVAAVGDGVTEWKPGTPVVINANLGDGTCDFCRAGLENQCLNWGLLGETRTGTYAEYVVVPARNLLEMPAHFDPHQAAAAGLVFHTAWHSLITRGNLRPGETVLVVGASGGVNTASIQIAKLAGAQVLVVGSNAGKLALAAALGADSLIDRSKDENWSREVYKLTGKRGVDVVVDNVGTTYYQSFRTARKGGRILTVGNTGAPKFEIDNRYIFGKHLSIIGSSMGTLLDFKTVMGLVFAGQLKAVVDHTFPLADASAAQERLESGAQLGKVTLAIE
jgi:NADPH:quinone reductase-like Zn-dependent oxidoreductase